MSRPYKNTASPMAHSPSCLPAVLPPPMTVDGREPRRHSPLFPRDQGVATTRLSRARRQAMAVAATLMAGGMVLGAGATASAAVSTSLPAEVSPADQAAILSSTNAIRQTEGAPPIAWDAALASGAQAWADNPASHASGLAHDTSFNNGAENMSSVAPSQAVSQWAGEKAAYDAAARIGTRMTPDTGTGATTGTWFRRITRRWGAVPQPA